MVVQPPVVVSMPVAHGPQVPPHVGDGHAVAPTASSPKLPAHDGCRYRTSQEVVDAVRQHVEYQEHTVGPRWADLKDTTIVTDHSASQR